MKPGKILSLAASFGAGFLTAVLVLKSHSQPVERGHVVADAGSPRVSPEVVNAEGKTRPRRELPPETAPVLSEDKLSTKAYVKHLRECDLSELLDEFERSLDGGGRVNALTYMNILQERVDAANLERCWRLFSAVKGDRTEKLAMQGQLLARFGAGEHFGQMLDLVMASSGAGRERTGFILRLFSEKPMDLAGFQGFVASMQSKDDVDAALWGLSQALGNSQNAKLIPQFLSSGNPDYYKGAVQALSGYIISNPAAGTANDFAGKFSTAINLLADGPPDQTKEGISKLVYDLRMTEAGVMLKALQEKFGSDVKLETVLSDDAVKGLAQSLAVKDPERAMNTFQAQPSLTAFTAAFNEWAADEPAASESWYSSHKAELSAGQQDVVAMSYAQIAIKAGDLDAAHRWADLVSASEAKAKIAADLKAAGDPP